MTELYTGRPQDITRGLLPEIEFGLPTTLGLEGVALMASGCDWCACDMEMLLYPLAETSLHPPMSPETS